MLKPVAATESLAFLGKGFGKVGAGQGSKRDGNGNSKQHGLSITAAILLW